VRRARRAAAAALLGLAAACAHAPPPATAPEPPRTSEEGPPAAPRERPPAPAPRERRDEIGVASYYAHRFHGRRTASGARYDMHALTCAHPTLPFGTRLRVTELEGGRSVVVTVTDRGPFAGGRIVDVSLAAAKKLGMVKRGVARVRVERL
jgi:rare lipoprotein A